MIVQNGYDPQQQKLSFRQLLICCVWVNMCLVSLRLDPVLFLSRNDTKKTETLNVGKLLFFLNFERIFCEKNNINIGEERSKV